MKGKLLLKKKVAAEGNVTNDDEEREENSGRKLCKFRGDGPEESEVDEEESKPSPFLEDESESSLVSSVFNSRDLISPTESPGRYLLLKNVNQGFLTRILKTLSKTEHKESNQKVTQIMSEPES